MNLYNDIEPFACRWMQRLIDAGEIPEGTVSGKSITEITPDEVRGYAQCHFFAGVAGWSLALRLAGVPADFPVWTGSVPCQSFSTAGKQEGFADERHLWPEFFRLISECQPPVVLGEQVDAAIGFGWLDRVFLDLESAGYACGSIILPAASGGAPHQRHRIFWGAVRCGATIGRTPYAMRERFEECGVQLRESEHRGESIHNQSSSSRACQDDGDGRLGNTDCTSEIAHAEEGASRGSVGESGGDGGLADTQDANGRSSTGQPTKGRRGQVPQTGGCGVIDAWSDYRIIPCRDSKHRRIGRCVQPLAARLPRSVGQVQPGLERMGRVAADLKESLRLAKRNRNGRLKGYGNAIVAPLAAVFIRAFLESIRSGVPYGTPDK